MIYVIQTLKEYYVWSIRENNTANRAHLMAVPFPLDAWRLLTTYIWYKTQNKTQVDAMVEHRNY